MAAGTHLEIQRREPLTAEAMALRWTLMMINDLGMDNVIVE